MRRWWISSRVTASSSAIPSPFRHGADIDLEPAAYIAWRLPVIRRVSRIGADRLNLRAERRNFEEMPAYLNACVSDIEKVHELPTPNPR
jgi:hypothetical protein